MVHWRIIPKKQLYDNGYLKSLSKIIFTYLCWKEFSMEDEGIIVFIEGRTNFLHQI